MQENFIKDNCFGIDDLLPKGVDNH